MLFRRLYILVVSYLWFSSSFVWAQTEEEIGVEDLIIDQIAEEMEEGFDLSEFTERLRYYRKHPIDLNRANEAALSELLFLSPLQIANLLHHREMTGRFISLLELQGIEGFDLQTIQHLEPFVRVEIASPWEEMSFGKVWSESEQDVMLRYGRILQKQNGYTIEDETRSRYLGDPNRYMVRYRSNYQNYIRLAINMEKDAGEPFFREKQRYGFDHYGFSLYIKGKAHLQELIIGDYAMQVGQGLVLWNGLSFGKGALIHTSARQGVGLKSYTSMNEHNFLRGVATRLQFGRLEWTPFISYRTLSGDRTLGESGNNIGTISSSGLHRTPTEQAYRKAITQKAAGMNLAFRVERLKLGVSVLHMQFNGDITPADQLRNLYAFRGSQQTNASVHYQYTFRNIYLYGETAWQMDGGWATNNGLIGSLHPQLSVFANYRNYHRDYHAFFGQSLSEGTAVSNEKGMYSGFSYHPSRRIEWVNYVDLFRFPWLRFRVDAPSEGLDFLSQFTYTWYKKGKLSLRYRHRLKEENVTGSVAENFLTQTLRNQLRLSFQYKLSDAWEVRTRTEGLQYHKEGNTALGGLVYQDVFWRSVKPRLQLNMRLAFFHTDSYDARLYAFENDVLYANSFPLYNGKGWRSYLNLRYRFGRKADFWMRYAMTRYSGQDAVGTGLEESEGNIRSDLKLQLRYQW